MKNKLYIVSLFITCCIIVFLYSYSLKDQTALPSEQWSRSFQVNTEESNFSKLQTVQEENGYTIGLLDFKKFLILSCNMDLECEKERTIDSLNAYKNSWSNKTDAYFIREDALIHSNSSTGETEIAAEVTNFSMTEDTLLYWKEDQTLVVLDKPFSTEKQHFQTDAPIVYAKILNNQVFIITEDKNEELYKLYSLSNELTQLFQFHISSQYILSSLHIIQQSDDTYSLLVDKKIVSGGSSSKMLEAAPFHLTANQSPEFHKLSFIDDETGMTLKDVQSPSLFQGAQGPMITFSSTFFDMSGDKVTEIFAGDFVGDEIAVQAATKPGSRYERSIFLNDHTVAYLKMNGKNRSLEYSSSDEVLKEKSAKIMDGDYKAAAYALIAKFFNGFIFIIIALSWIIITFIFTYLVLLLLQKKRFVYTYETTFIAHIIALFSTETYFLYHFTSVDSLVRTIPFITENWHFIVLLLIAWILSIAPLFVLRYKVSEDTINLFIVYTTFMNLIVLFFLVGPYIF